MNDKSALVCIFNCRNIVRRPMLDYLGRGGDELVSVDINTMTYRGFARH